MREVNLDEGSEMNMVNSRNGRGELEQGPHMNKVNSRNVQGEFVEMLGNNQREFEKWGR